MASGKDVGNKAPLEVSFLSEEGGMHNKLMIRGSRLCSRNDVPFFPLPHQTITVPEGMSTLDDALFRNFVRDIQASIRFAEDSSPSHSEWWFFYAGYVSLSYLFDHHYVDEQGIWYVALFAVILAIYCIWCKTFRDALEQEINSRIQEWQPWFGSAGFALQYVVDKPRWWNFTETYLLIEPVAVREIVKTPVSVANNEVDETQTAKYLVYFARSFVPRNQGFRVLDVRGSGQLQRMVIPKAPALWNLDTSVFLEIMNEAKVESSLYSREVTKRMIGVFCFTLILGFVLIPNKSYCFVTAVCALVLALFTYYDILPAVGAYTLPSEKMEEWNRRLNDHGGYTLTYHVDKSTWWQWHESYLKIQPDNKTSLSAPPPPSIST